jgi:hypothetical protein
LLYRAFSPFMKKKYPLFMPQKRMEFWDKKASEAGISKKNKLRFEQYRDAYKICLDMLKRNASQEFLTPEQAKKMLDANLAPYVQGAKAIETLPSYFGTVTKQVKKFAKEKPLFNTTMKRLRNIYTEKRANLNEGNNALRKRNEIQSVYDDFLQTPAVLQEKEDQARKQAEHEERQRIRQQKASEGGRRKTVRKRRD